MTTFIYVKSLIKKGKGCCGLPQQIICSVGITNIGDSTALQATNPKIYQKNEEKTLQNKYQCICYSALYTNNHQSSFSARPTQFFVDDQIVRR